MKRDRPDPRVFVQVMRYPSVGVEVTRGTPWVGVDQQVGHGSADALFALTHEQYVEMLAHGAATTAPLDEFWRGEHPDRLLHHPGERGPRPEHFVAARERMLEQRFRGELWWHVDALADGPEGRHTQSSRSLGAGAVDDASDGRRSLVLPLVGEGAYLRPGALIGGLDAGSDRDAVRAALGEPVEGDDVFAAEGARVHARFVDGGLVGVRLERRPRIAPGGVIGTMLRTLGEPEQGERYRECAALAGAGMRRWSAGRRGRRLLDFDGGMEMQVDDDRILSVRLDLAAGERGAPRVSSEGLGHPDDAYGARELYDFAQGVLLVDHALGVDGEAPTVLTAVVHGTTVSQKFHRWRSGDVSMFLDILGRDAQNPLVAHVRSLRGVRVRLRGRHVVAVEVERARVPAFVDGLPAQPRRRDIPFGAPDEYGDRDDLWGFGDGFVLVHAEPDGRIADITVCVEDEIPRGLRVRPWRFGRDSMDAWRALSAP